MTTRIGPASEGMIVGDETSNRWIGKSTIRPDGEDKVTGRATFGADFAQPGMLWARYCAARIRTPASSRSTSDVPPRQHLASKP